jgi:hypothetical protein
MYSYQTARFADDPVDVRLTPSLNTLPVPESQNRDTRNVNDLAAGGHAEE